MIFKQCAVLISFLQHMSKLIIHPTVKVGLEGIWQMVVMIANIGQDPNLTGGASSGAFDRVQKFTHHSSFT